MQQQIHAGGIQILYFRRLEVAECFRYPLDLNISFDIQAVQRIIFARKQFPVFRRDVQKFTMRFHQLFHQIGNIFFSGVQLGHVSQNQGDASGADGILFRKLFKHGLVKHGCQLQFCHIVFPDGKALSSIQRVKTN